MQGGALSPVSGIMLGQCKSALSVLTFERVGGEFLEIRRDRAMKRRAAVRLVSAFRGSSKQPPTYTISLGS
jgi:hypothetical protein